MPSEVTNHTPEVAVATKPPAGGATSSFKHTLIKLAVAAALLGIAYGVGRFQAGVERGVIESIQARATHLEARRQLHLALMALEDRNFGTAQKTLTQAGSLLAQHEPSDELQALSNEVGGYKLKAGEDISTERQKLMAWIVRFDELLKPPSP